MHGAYETGKTTANADLIIAIGARFSDRVAGDREKFGENATIIHMDIDKAEINKNVKSKFSLIGDLKDTLTTLTALCESKSNPEWLKEISDWKAQFDKTPEYNSKDFAHAYHIIESVQKLTTADDIIVTDVGQHQMWVSQKYKFEKPRTWCTSGGLGTMGYGMGAAIGAQTANPDKRVVLFTGDGSFHMNLNETVTLKSYNLPIMVVVMNNSVLGMVRQWQKLFYGHRFSQTDPHRATDFVELAKAFGIDGMRVHNDSEVESVLERHLTLKPVIVDCVLSPDENVLPMIPPGKTVDDMITEME